MSAVHVEVAGFQGYGEFHGSHVDCSADAELMARHPFDGSLLDATTLNQIWYDYTSAGHGDSGGAKLADIHWHLTESSHRLDPHKATVTRYIPVDTVSLDTLRTALVYELARGHTAISFVGRALALPDNEQGVYGHFIAFGGIDSDAGYLVGNGDELEALGGHGIIPTHWIGWDKLVSAQINGLIAVAKVAPIIPSRPPTPAPTTGTIPPGWTDTQGGNPANFAGVLSAANGIPVVRGMRAYVLTHTWATDNTPLAPEYLASQIELANPASGKGSRQDFRYGSLGCQQHSDGSWGSPYPIMVGNELTALGKSLTTLHAALQQIAALAKE